MTIDARRIAACLNACTGISTADLERFGVRLNVREDMDGTTPGFRAAAIALVDCFDWDAPKDRWRWMPCAEAVRGLPGLDSIGALASVGRAFRAKGCECRRSAGRNLVLCPPRKAA